MPRKQHGRQYDLLVLGATGYTGKFVAEHVTTHLPTDLKWAIAGRSESKLQAVMDECHKLNADRAPPKLELANIDDEAELNALISKAFVVITTVGPYCKYGDKVFKACADAGTHYLDCTGEFPWVARMINKYEKTAQKSGAIMFPQSGLESVPADICTWAMARFLRSKLDASTSDVVLSIHKLNSAPSGGTLASALGIFDHFSLQEMRESSKPYASSPVPHHEKPRPSTSILQAFLGVRNVPNLGLQTTSISSTIDIPIVERTWGLLSQIPSRRDQFYGPKFNWASYYKPRNWLHGILLHWGLALGSLIIATLPPVRALLKKFVYKPGEGTGKDALAKEEVEIRGVATPDTATPSGKQAYCRAWFHGSIYYLTAVFMAQGALTILEDDLELDGGVYTPACLGQGYVDRLHNAGFKMEVKMLPN
ncbi:hypothetical protein RJ55_05241 [Drechmeria coniospora]|nr:hypothetical protein RJ55_05241 [Drechmeria coniospora]